MTTPLPLAITGIEWTVAALVAVLGLAIGLWFTRVFWIDLSTGQATTLFARIRAGVLFILSGTVPGAIQALAVSGPGGSLTMAAFCGGFGIGLVVGYFLPQRSLAQNVFMLALSMRVRVAGGMPQPMEVFAIGDEVGSESAKRLLGLDDTQFSNLFALGASHLNPVFTAAPPLDVAVMTKALCGVPVTQLARDYGVSVQQVVDMLDRIP